MNRPFNCQSLECQIIASILKKVHTLLSKRFNEIEFLQANERTVTAFRPQPYTALPYRGLFVRCFILIRNRRCYWFLIVISRYLSSFTLNNQRETWDMCTCARPETMTELYNRLSHRDLFSFAAVTIENDISECEAQKKCVFVLQIATILLHACTYGLFDGHNV